MTAFLWFAIPAMGLFALILLADGLLMGIPTPACRGGAHENAYILPFPPACSYGPAYQKSTECSGFACAYVLRSLGIDAEGNALYARMPGRLKNGAVLPKNVKRLLKQSGLSVSYAKGSLDTMKAQLCAGKRIIALIKTRADKPWLHYVPVAGYDEGHIFIAESMQTLVNCGEPHYNRRLSNEEFLRLWDTRAWYLPFYRKTYLVVENT